MYDKNEKFTTFGSYNWSLKPLNPEPKTKTKSGVPRI